MCQETTPTNSPITPPKADPLFEGFHQSPTFQEVSRHWKQPDEPIGEFPLSESSNIR